MVQMKPTYEQVIQTLRNWGFNNGEFEEVIVKLSQNDEVYIKNADARIHDDTIVYELQLTKEGIEKYLQWCEENGFSSGLVNGNILEFEDQDEESVQNTLAEWGI